MCRWVNLTTLTVPVYQYSLGGEVVVIYEGAEFRYLDKDESLLPFTQYKYRVRASNSKGFVESEWAYIRTKEALPYMVPRPIVKVGVLVIRVDDIIYSVLGKQKNKQNYG